MIRCRFEATNDAGTEFRCTVCGAVVRTSKPTRPEAIWAECGSVAVPADGVTPAPGAPGIPIDQWPGPHGPGWWLHRIIRERTGEDVLPGCECLSWIRQMDAWGIAGCRGEHLGEIVARLVGEAAKRGWRLDNATLGARMAARLARWAAKVPGVSWARSEVAQRVSRRWVLDACRRAEEEAAAAAWPAE